MQATTDLEKFLTRFQDFKGVSDDDRNKATSALEEGSRRLEHAKAMMCEALMHHGLSQKIKSSGKDLVRAQLAEVAGRTINEDLLCPLLLKASRDFIG